MLLLLPAARQRLLLLLLPSEQQQATSAATAAALVLCRGQRRESHFNQPHLVHHRRFAPSPSVIATSRQTEAPACTPTLVPKRGIFFFSQGGGGRQPWCRIGPPSPSKIGIITSTNCCAEVDTSSGDSGGGGGGAKVGNGGGLSNGVQKRNLFLDANKMAPVSSQEGLDAVVNSSTVVVFFRPDSPESEEVRGLLEARKLEAKYVELGPGKSDEGSNRLREGLRELTGQDSLPQVFVNGMHLGDHKDASKAAVSGRLSGMLTQTASEAHQYDYDVVVIGGGSGGLAASKEAARLNRKVAVCDFVTPSPQGTSWGLGGTCVNVGCIPKKLMHQASLLGELRKDSAAFGFPAVPEDENSVDWPAMVQAVQDHIGSLNWGYRVALRDKGVKYLNEYATFVDAHTIKTRNKKGKESTVTAKSFIIATGGRPRYPNVPGARELAITSDDIFSLPYNPGKTLLVGASYISLETAGFLHGIGIRATVMVRSILLRGFDQQCANKIGDFMEEEGVNFIRGCVPTALERVEEGKPGKIKVTAKYTDGTPYEDWFNTVIFAIGRDAETKGLNLEAAGVEVNPKNGKIIHDKEERTSAENIYAIGDVLDGKPELTPMAIQSGILLARRLCKVSQVLTDYEKVPTTVFTPLEYGTVGLAEEDAEERFGADAVEVYHKNFWPLEWTLPKRPENACYAKLVCHKDDSDRVVGFHYLGPNAGEVTQGYAGMLVMGATKADFDRLVGIHPTTAEVFTTMDITKGSGVDPSAAGC